MINWDNTNVFDLGAKRIQITKEEFSEFLHLIPEERKDFTDFDMCADPMGGFIQKITNNLLYNIITKKYTHQLIILRGPVRMDSPEHIYQFDGLTYKIFTERENDNEI